MSSEYRKFCLKYVELNKIINLWVNLTGRSLENLRDEKFIHRFRDNILGVDLLICNH